jgi:hypothetical protein
MKWRFITKKSFQILTFFKYYKRKFYTEKAIEEEELEEEQEEYENEKITFGKHTGTKLIDLPFSYIKFLTGYYSREMSSWKWIKNNHPDIVIYSRNSMLGKCHYCGYMLVPIGNNRVGGAEHQDWISRKYHKQCWIEIQEKKESKQNS